MGCKTKVKFYRSVIGIVTVIVMILVSAYAGKISETKTVKADGLWRFTGNNERTYTSNWSSPTTNRCPFHS